VSWRADRIRAEIVELENKIDDLRVALAEELSPFTIGDIICKKAGVKGRWRRGPYRVMDLFTDPTMSHSVLSVSNVKKDGRVGVNQTNLFDAEDYELVKP